MRYLPFFIIAFVPQLAFGQDSAGLVTCNGPDCNFCSLMQMADNIIQFLFVILVLAAVLSLVIAGFRLVTSQGNPGAMERAKKMVSNILIGFVIILSAWLIVDTVIKAIANRDGNGGFDFGMWNQISDVQCGVPDPASSDTSNTLYCYTTQGEPAATCVYGLSTCEANRAEAIDSGFVVGSCTAQ